MITRIREDHLNNPLIDLIISPKAHVSPCTSRLGSYHPQAFMACKAPHVTNFPPFSFFVTSCIPNMFKQKKKKILKQKTLLQKHFLYRTTIRYILDIHLIEKFLLSEGKMKGNKIIVIKTVLEVDLTKELVHYIFGSTNGTFIELYVYKLIK